MQKITLISVVVMLGLTACAPITPEMKAPTAMPKVAAPTTNPVAQAGAASAFGAINPKIGLPDIDPLKSQGRIISAGSSTVFPLSQRVAEIFKDEGFKGEITIDSIGTGAGFERFCKGETDISNASAKISQAQIDTCTKNNIQPLEFRIATDALAVVMSNENNFVQSLTIKQLADIYSGTYKTWDQVDASFPKEKIILFSPGTDSGTFDYFVEKMFNKDKKPLLANNPQLSEDDNVLVRGVEGSKYAIGYFGYAYYQAEKSRLKAIKIEGIDPNRENVDNAKYPLARPLFMYSTKKIMTDKPQVAAFIAFYLIRINEALKKVAYFPAPDAEAAKARTTWVDSMRAP